MKKLPKKIAIPIIGASIVLFGYFITKDLLPYSPPPVVESPVSAVVERKLKYEAPLLNLPLRYFSENVIASGSGESGTLYPQWDNALVDEGYRSFPTTVITLESFSTDVEKLPPIKPLSELMKPIGKEIAENACANGFCADEEHVPWGWLYKEQVQEYGDFATRFLSGGDFIDLTSTFDVDQDGNDELIVGLCGIGGNHCPHEIIIIKGNRQIFSTWAGLTGLDILSTDTGNGFYVHWVPTGTNEKWDEGLCCPLGYKRTRFVYENGAFKPVYEQDVWYIKVQNITSE